MAFSGKSSNEDFSEINITPLTDVFLILFLIMIVIAPMIRETALKIEPPKAQHGKALASNAKVINLEISKEGVFAINGKKLAEGKSIEPEQVSSIVSQRLQEIIADEKYKDAPLNIIADADTQQKFVVGALDAASGIGITKMNIVTVSNLS
jgi:biopolymer transport protein ExbD